MLLIIIADIAPISKDINKLCAHGTSRFFQGMFLFKANLNLILVFNTCASHTHFRGDGFLIVLMLYL